MSRRTRGIAHVVKTVKESDEIELLLRITLGRRDLEASVSCDAMLPSMRPSMLDRTRVKVVANELRVRERLGHQHGGPAMPAPDIGNLGAAFQFFDDAVERRKPIAHEIIVVARAEEAGDRAEETACMIAPRHAAA